MADEQDKDQKTEAPTEKRLREALEKGQVAVTQEARHAVVLAGFLVLMGGMGVAAVVHIGRELVRLWGNAEDYPLEPAGAQSLMTGILAQLGLVLLPVAGLFMGSALLAFVLQGRPTLSWSRVKPQWSKLNPARGLVEMFGRQKMVGAVRGLVKFSIILTIVLIILWPKAATLDGLVGIGPLGVARSANALVFQLVKAVLIAVAAIALGDYLYQRYAFMQRMRMTKQEVKDEYKQNEGDPQIKRRVRSIQFQRSRQRMMAAVPTASVVITNPTHFAVALKYEHGEMAAPVVVAKGADEIAFKIREIAAANNVPVVESPPLARALYATADLDRPIPVEHYTAVAEVIGYIMRLARGRGA